MVTVVSASPGQSGAQQPAAPVTTISAAPPEPAPARSGSRKVSRGGRTLFDLFAVLLLGIATVATAWCGIQSSRWNGEEADAAREENLGRIEGSRLFALASQEVAYDATMTAKYAEAVVDGNERMQTFVRTYLIRPEFLPFLEDWQSRVEAGDETVSNLFTDDAYLDSQFAESRATTAASDIASARSAESAKTADDYLLTTLLTATALFFAGVTTSFGTRSARLALLAASIGVLAVTAARLVDLPVI